MPAFSQQRHPSISMKGVLDGGQGPGIKVPRQADAALLASLANRRRAFAYNNLISAYNNLAKLGQNRRAPEVFASMREDGLTPLKVSYQIDYGLPTTAPAAPAAPKQENDEALDVFTSMRQAGLKPDMSDFSAFLMACEQMGSIEKEVALMMGLLDAVGLTRETFCALETATTNALTVAMFAAGITQKAHDALREAGFRGRVDGLSEALWDAAGGEGKLATPHVDKGRIRVREMPNRAAYSKELQLMAHVFSVAQMGDTCSITGAIERFGSGVLSTEGRWLKIASDMKKDVLRMVLDHAPARGHVMEIGTYCGFSSSMMANHHPGRLVMSLEVEPAHMIIARNMIALGGLSHAIECFVGHSKDTIPSLPTSYPVDMPLHLAMIFMDQRGSRYDEDLEGLENLNTLSPGCVVIADNVLKPGSPSFLWTLSKSAFYRANIVGLREFAMPAEDWMSVHVRKPLQEVDEFAASVGIPPHPPELKHMQWQSDKIRGLARQSRTGVSYEDWAKHAEEMKEEFAGLGILDTVTSYDLEPLKEVLRDSTDSNFLNQEMR